MSHTETSCGIIPQSSVKKDVEDIWIIAGESSGDSYGAKLAEQLFTLNPGLTISGMGGQAMREAGVELLIDSTDLGVVGFVEVCKNLPVFVKTFRVLIRRAASERPDCVVLIDYPGFNIRFAEKLHKLGIPVVYYVSPQVWAWGKRRIPKMGRIIDKMLVIFPFESDVFADTSLDIDFVGHPLVEILAKKQKNLSEPPDRDLGLLLPGSRHNEVKRLLPPLLETARQLITHHPQSHFIIPTTSNKMYDYINDYIQQERNKHTEDIPVKVVREPAREWLGRADFGLAASGTVTVEAAIMGLPLVVVYKLNP
ncbi:MAG: lipid-A-disaccharide synthase, partial [Verrucomicrobiota bacterium]